MVMETCEGPLLFTKTQELAAAASLQDAAAPPIPCVLPSPAGVRNLRHPFVTTPRAPVSFPLSLET